MKPIGVIMTLTITNIPIYLYRDCGKYGMKCIDVHCCMDVRHRPEHCVHELIMDEKKRKKVVESTNVKKTAKNVTVHRQVAIVIADTFPKDFIQKNAPNENGA